MLNEMHAVGKLVQDKVSLSSPQTMSIDTDGSISAIALNRDASQVVVGGRNVFKIYSIEDDGFEERHDLRVGKRINLSYCATDIAWNHTEDNILATGATNGDVVIWDLNKPSRSKQDTVLHEHKRTVHRVCFHENEHRLLLTASQDGSAKLFDIRKKDGQSLTFSSGSTSVKDVQFSQLNYFSFASADDGGNIHFWDYRRPDKVEGYFTAHGGPVFSIDWHPEDRNWFATAGRDKMIKVWDLNNLNKAKNIYTIYSIASITRVRWRPQRRYHIASCALLVDCSINIWDVRRPYVPFALFDEHKDVTTSIAFKNKDPHILISGSKDSTLCQHVFRDAKRPGEDLVPAGLDISVFGAIGHADSDRQGKLEASENSGSKLTGYLPGGKKPPEKNESFVDVAAYLQIFRNDQSNISLSWMVESAKRYKLSGHSFEDLCMHNSKVAQDLNRPQVSQCWQMLLNLYTSHTVSTNTQHHKPSVGHGTSLDSKTTSKVKQDSLFDTDIEEKGKDGTSGNSDEETDDKEFNSNLSNVTRGQENPDWDYLFGGEDLTSYDIGLDLGANKQETWVLPREAFQPRHEIHDREAPPEALHNGPDTPHEIEHEEAVLVNMREKENKMSTSLIITTDMEYMKIADWEFAPLVVDMLKWFASEGDVQTPVCMLIVLKDKIRHYIDVDLQEDWFLSYIELLGRFKLWSIANDVVKLSTVPSVYMLNQRSTLIHINCNWKQQFPKLLGRFKLWSIANDVVKLSTVPSVYMLNQRSTLIHINCNSCSKPLKRAGWLCERCKKIINRCSICHLPVKGLYLWCQGCSHGGHVQHIKDWFSRNIECPTGCGHICQYT